MAWPVRLGRREWPSKSAFFRYLADTYSVPVEAAAARYYATGRSAKETAAWAEGGGSRVTVGGQTYDSKLAFFRDLAARYGVALETVRWRHYWRDESLEEVAAWAREPSSRVNAGVTVRGQTYDSKLSFFRDLAARYGVALETARWRHHRRDESLEEVAAWAVRTRTPPGSPQTRGSR
jgi:hypothetical protein